MRIFENHSPGEFEKLALETFQYQLENVNIYHNFLKFLKIEPSRVASLGDIPFLPVDFFKSHKIIHSSEKPEIIFTSSGTTGMQTSKHHISNLQLYEQSFQETFKLFYGDPASFCILALLPSYLERKGSSLVYMADKLIRLSNNPESGFYLNNYKELNEKLLSLVNGKQRILLLGVSYALLDLAEQFPMDLSNTIVMETGGMKGRRKELTRQELHNILIKSFNVLTIHSEYGMTELLSQAYSKGDGKFFTPPWMKIIIKDPYDPLNSMEVGNTGLINIIDLANLNSCSFIATSDLGRVNRDGSFEVLGRMDQSELRGCNLMVV
jgi:phenylacetate-coenzyme A ligase PaaK-like adenylate-forming protein